MVDKHELLTEERIWQAFKYFDCKDKNSIGFEAFQVAIKKTDSNLIESEVN